MNLSYEPNQKFAQKIVDDKGVELVLDALEFYHNKKEEANTETAIDALTMLTHSPLVLKHIEKKDNKSVDILVDILRQKLSSNLVYKSLRCLTNFAQSEKIEKKILKKDAAREAANLFKDFKDDHKNIYQAVKFLSVLIKKNPDKIEDFIFAGIPEKITENFSH